jgi:DNA invertase Pin-like site-specific DNA recombinase
MVTLWWSTRWTVLPATSKTFAGSLGNSPAAGVKVEFVKESLTFAGDDSPMNTLLLSMLGAVAEFERSMILERQREGIAIAKSAGKYKGREASLSQTQASGLRERLAKGESVTALATEYGVSRETVYNYKVA